MRHPALKGFLRLIPLLATLLLMAAAPAVASAGSESCFDDGIACISDTGFAGEPIWGYPVDSAGNNCVAYAAFRLSRNGLADPGSYGNATYWADKAAAQGVPVDGKPAAGSIAQWTTEGDFAPQYGHVAYVERVSGNTIYLSESNWQGGSRLWSVKRGDAEWPENFIHFKDVPNPADPSPAVPDPVDPVTPVTPVSPSTPVGDPAEAKPARARATAAGRKLAKLGLELRCPAEGAACVTAVTGSVTVKLRHARAKTLRLSRLQLNLASGRTRVLMMPLPAGLKKMRPAAKQIRLTLRVDTRGIEKSSVVHLRLK